MFPDLCSHKTHSVRCAIQKYEFDYDIRIRSNHNPGSGVTVVMVRLFRKDSLLRTILKGIKGNFCHDELTNNLRSGWFESVVVVLWWEKRLSDSSS